MNSLIGRIALPILGLAMGSLGFYHVGRESQSLPTTTPIQDPARSPYENSIAGSGMVEARTKNIAVGAALAGLVLEVYVPADRVGTRVAVGQPLFRVDDRHLKAQLKVARAQLAVAVARLAKLKRGTRPEVFPPVIAQVKAATAHADRLLDQSQRAQRLVRTGAIAQEEYVRRQRAYEAATHEQVRAQAEYDLLKAGTWQPDIQIANAAVNEARAQVEQVEMEIERATVVSPVDGLVLQVNIRAGERICDQGPQSLVLLADISAYHVRVDIDERDIGRFRPGAPAVAYPRGTADQEMPLRFLRVEPLVVPKKSLTGENTELVDTRVLQVLYAIDEPSDPAAELAVKPGSVFLGQQVDVFIDAE
jgi:multidrug resistance efflux pump